MHYNSVMRIDFGIKVYEKNELGRWDMKIKKVCRMLGVTLLAASLMAVPVSAAPSVDELQKEKAAAQSQVSSLQQELTGILVKLDELETELVEKGQEVTQVTSDLEAAKEKEAKQYEDMKLRIQYMYEDGDATFVSKLLESNSIADILNQAEYVSKVHSYDRKALEEYVKTTQQVAELKTTLETEISNLENMQTTYSEEKDNLNSTIETKKAEVSDFDQQIQAAAAAAAAARQKELEEQTRRAAAAAENQGNSGQAQSGVGQSGNTSANNGQTAQGSTAGNASSENSAGTQDQNQAAQPEASVDNTVNSGNSQDEPYYEDNSSAEEDTGSSSNSGSGWAVVSAAENYLGVPYVWGGASGSGVDCSGLVLLAHQSIGVSLAHSSGSQGGGGQAVSGMANALPGDVVCYPGHVGIYIGNGQMIHAPEPGDVVKVSSVYGSPWFRRYW